MDTQTNKKLAAALYYAEHFSWSVIPLRPGDKKPLIAWDRYKTERASSEQIKTWWSKWPDANIGIVTGKISGFVVIDIDNEDGFRAIAIYLPEGFITPEQTTPKGGSHLLCKHPMTIDLPNNARMIPGCDFRGDGGYIVAAPSVNGNGKGWTWVDGKKPSQIPFAELPEAYLRAITATKQHQTEEIPGIMFQEGRRDEDLFHIANCLVKGGAKQHEISQTLERLINSWGETDQKWVRAKVESALKRAEKRERNVTSEIRNYVAMTEGYFTLEEIYRSIGLNDREEKATARKALERLVKDNEIERHSQRDGIFRRIDEDAPLIDYKNASEETIPVNYPFAIHELVNTYPGNIITVAGTMNAGKTAFLLNFVAMNMLAFRVKYFSSEMGPSEFKVRLSKFENVPFDDWNFEARERSGNFADVIRPDDKPTIWVVDFLELLDEFWKVGMMLKAIHDKLAGSKDIAVVALQKAHGTDVGRGGDFGLEKPRLALAMESGRVKIVKAKFWKNSLKNPNGLYKEYGLVNGCKIMNETDWFYDDDRKIFKRR